MTSSSNDHRNNPLDEPPPYTLRPDPLQGETTIEYGPSRPYQPPPHPPPQPHSQAPQLPSRTQQTSSSFLSPQPTGFSSFSNGRGGSLWQQLSDQIDQIATRIERQSTGSNNRYPGAATQSWSSYPGQSTNQSLYGAPPGPPPSQNHLIPPPLHPSASSISLPTGASDFARDFYAAGPGENTSSEPTQHIRGSRSVDHHSQDDRSPTTTPIPGRPLLHEGKLLVYPKSHVCQKCHNTGYKHYDPLRPCNKCWFKYGRPFNGPLAYSFSSSSTSSSTSNTHNTNLQKPLPYHTPTLRTQQQPLLAPRSVSAQPGSYGGGYQNQTPGPFSLPGFIHSPPPGSTIYQPGDPRIGGNLCRWCNGKGSLSVLIDTISCPMCGGSGRTFF